MNGALLGVGEVRHTRLRPVRNDFAYPTFFLLLPMRHLRDRPEPALRRNRFAWVGFHDRDHGDGRADSLAWLDELLQREGIADATGEVWLHCLPRMLGHTFKPVSFWYAHRKDKSLAAVLVEDAHTCMDTPLLGARTIIAHHNATLNGPFVRLATTADVTF